MRQQRTATGTVSKLTGVKEEIRSRLNAADVIGKYVELRRIGKDLAGLCPFHHEKTPSFHVDSAKGLYYCFGCKEGGDLFDFVMKMEGLSFSEALTHLAEQAGVDVSDTSDSPEARERKRQQELIAQVNKLAQRFYARALLAPEGQAARTYLAKRGVRADTIKRFGIGYAPDRWDALTKYLNDAEMTQAGIKAGLLIEKAQAHMYDRFRNRIMFPFVGMDRRIVAFGGRALDGEPKYLNSPETLLYSKRYQLYGMYQAKEAIRRQSRAIVVEGYFDSIALYQAGIEYVVASCGTALTREHLQVLRRTSKELYLCFDGDQAGRAAVTKGLDALQDTELSVKVVLMPDGHDPDTYLQQHGSAGFHGLFEKALPLTDYLLEMAVSLADLRTVEGRMKGVRAALPILRNIKSQVERDAYIQRVSVRLGVSAQSLAAETAGASKKSEHNPEYQHTNLRNRNTSRDSVRHAPPMVTVSPRTLIERELLHSLFKDPGNAQEVIAELGEAPFHTAAYNAALKVLAQMNASTPDINALVEAVGPELVAQWQADESYVSWSECVTRLKVEHMRNEIALIEQGLSTLSVHNPEQYIIRVSDALQAFRRWRRALRDQLPSESQAS
jgi:DNA primase